MSEIEITETDLKCAREYLNEKIQRMSHRLTGRDDSLIRTKSIIIAEFIDINGDYLLAYIDSDANGKSLPYWTSNGIIMRILGE
jgi:hypothetical protein